MYKYIFPIIACGILTACNLNEEDEEYFSSKPHNPDLIGKWKLINDNSTSIPSVIIIENLKYREFKYNSNNVLKETVYLWFSDDYNISLKRYKAPLANTGIISYKLNTAKDTLTIMNTDKYYKEN